MNINKMRLQRNLVDNNAKYKCYAIQVDSFSIKSNT
jgi:hypothetical protein